MPREPESAFRLPMMAPIATLFTVPTGYRFQDPACGGVDFICWPTVAASSVESYAGLANGIPGWDRVLLVSALKRGIALRDIRLTPRDVAASNPIAREARTQNRYRDIAVHPDGRTIFVATDSDGLVEAPNGGVAKRVDNGGAILAFTYAGESARADDRTAAGDADANVSRNRADSGACPAASVASSNTTPAASPARASVQPRASDRRQDSLRRVVRRLPRQHAHERDVRTPLAGEYFRRQWSGRSVAELFEKSRTTMPPKATGSLPDATHAAIIAYVLEVNGSVPGDVDLPADAARLPTHVARDSVTHGLFGLRYSSPDWGWSRTGPARRFTSR